MLTISLAILLLLPSVAYAWGPGTHLDIAVTVLQNLAWVLPAIRKIIEKNPNEYIYGSVSPDIITGKKYAGWMHHCHNWSIGKLILEEAKTEAEQAAAWGYCTHLAADTVAHNYFVPYKLIRSFPNRSLGHTYWEMRYDIFVPEDRWQNLSHVIRKKYSSFDHLLERVLKKTLFSFRMNKRIFNSILILHKMKQMRLGLKAYSNASRFTMMPDEVEHFRGLFLGAVRDFLKNPDKSICLRADPSGQRKLLYAKEMQTTLRRLRREEAVDSKQLETFLKEVRRQLERGVYDATVQLPSV